MNPADEATTPAATKPGKNKALAVVLAVLVSYFSWLYTWKFDAWKFWACLVINIVLALLAGFILPSLAAEAIVIWAASGLWLLLAVVDQGRKRPITGRPTASSRRPSQRPAGWPAGWG